MDFERVIEIAKLEEEAFHVVEERARNKVLCSDKTAYAHSWGRLHDDRIYVELRYVKGGAHYDTIILTKEDFE